MAVKDNITIEDLKLKQAELKKRKGAGKPRQSGPKFKFKAPFTFKSKAEIEAWERENKQAVAAPVQQLDLFSKCDDDSAAMPNTIARSALFAPIARGRRKYIDNEVIASRKDVKITFSGVQLDMGDADVFMQAIRLADQKKLGTEFQILPYGFLSELGRCGKTKPGKGNLVWLQKSFMRLRKGLLIVETKKCIFTPSLILDYTYDKTTGAHYLKLDPRIVALFRKEQYALIDWEKRKKIEVNFSKWLQTYIASNKKGTQRVSIEKLKTWCGKEGMRLDKFKTSLKKALEELEKLKIIKNFNINEKNIITYIRL